MRTETIYNQLAEHLAELSMGYPYSEALVELLATMFTPQEVKIAMAMAQRLLNYFTVPVTKQVYGQSPTG